MTSSYSPFTTSYPSSRGPLGKIFRPVADYRTYLRAGHMLLMFPLGIAYFVFFAVTLSVGGSLIWTLIGPVVLIASLFISRWLGDLEAVTAGYISGTPIRRPPSRIEGVSNFRSQVKVRLVDPTTWTGLVYLIAQFPIGIAAFVSLVVVYSFAGAMAFAPLIAIVTDEPIVIFHIGGLDTAFNTPIKALLITPFGILGFILASHAVIVFSSIHGWWARLMLGSRSTRISSRSAPAPTGGDHPGLPATASTGVVTPDSSDEIKTDPGSGAKSEAESPEPATPTPFNPAYPATAARPSEILPLVLTPSDNGPDIAPNSAAIRELTAREQEVFMLMARGDANADIAEELFISEGTVKTHVKRVLSKLDMRDRTQVVVFAYEHRFVIPHSTGEATTSEVARLRLMTGR